jgi:hypothetical protein
MAKRMTFSHQPQTCFVHPLQSGTILKLDIFFAHISAPTYKLDYIHYLI